MFLKQLFKILSVSVLLNSVALFISYISVSLYIESPTLSYDATHFNIIEFLSSGKGVDTSQSKNHFAASTTFKKIYFFQSSSYSKASKYIKFFLLFYTSALSIESYFNSSRSRAPPILLFS
jgi:hypothetical protein